MTDLMPKCSDHEELSPCLYGCHVLVKHGSPMLAGPLAPVSIPVVLVGSSVKNPPSRGPRGLLDRAHLETQVPGQVRLLLCLPIA